MNRLTIPPELPIAAHADELIETLRKSPVTIVCGDTGSGKTTQLPKLAHLARPEARGMIGVTQPRRLAAIAMARRLAEESAFPDPYAPSRAVISRLGYCPPPPVLCYSSDIRGAESRRRDTTRIRT